jgi:hypothetical protein
MFPQRLKYRIRVLKLVSRLVATGISLAVFVPIAMTFNVFLQTRDTFRTVDTATTSDYRTAWAKQTNPWPTYMYFSVALASLFLNACIVVAYSRSIKLANIAATTSTVFEWLVILSNLIVWIVAVTLYRTEKDKGGKPNDLWGWTCSDAARLIQHAFEEVDFNRYCGIQVRARSARFSFTGESDPGPDRSSIERVLACWHPARSGHLAFWSHLLSGRHATQGEEPCPQKFDRKVISRGMMMMTMMTMASLLIGIQRLHETARI